MSFYKTNNGARVNKTGVVLACSLALSACIDTGQKSHSDELAHHEKVLLDFETPEHFAQINVDGGELSVAASRTNSQARIQLNSAAQHITQFAIKPDTAWDLSQEPPFALALDIANPNATSISFYVITKDANGGSQIRTMAVPKVSQQTYYIDLGVPGLAQETGIRSNPPVWDEGYTPIIWRGGHKQLDLSAISEISFDVRGVLDNKTVDIDNVRLVYPKHFDQQSLQGLVDQFGQNAKLDYATKVSSVDELRAIAEKEAAALRNTPLPGRSRFNGWKNGPQLDATGFYRTEKLDGKWWLVDPEGYLFFSNGIANIRMANTSTITGYDFDKRHIPQRAEGDLTPEDSLGLNTAPKAAWPSRYVASELRAKMFNWLPSYDSPEGAHYGYRREVHTGVLEHGETYSFYRANLARKYGSHEPDAFITQWKDNTIDRMLSWGFTSFGNWVDPMFYHEDRLPYFANGWIIGDFKTVSSGNDYWSPMPDVFDPVFAERADITVKQVAAEVNNNPWCVGVFIDNEKSWGMMGSDTAQYGIVYHALSLKAAESPLKAAFVAVLKAKYRDIQLLNSAWGSDIASWESFAQGYEAGDLNTLSRQDFASLLHHYSDTYFAIVADAMERHMPNHLYMGARFADWAMTPEVRAAAAKHVDVMSYNYYREGISDVFWSFLEDLDKPSIIGEFHNGATDSGMYNPGLIHAEDQHDRGIKYQEYMYSVIDHPYFVGAHWFQYIDSPLTGRAYDGENYNVGFVSVTDIPYQPLVDAAFEVNQSIYPRRFSEGKK